MCFFFCQIINNNIHNTPLNMRNYLFVSFYCQKFKPNNLFPGNFTLLHHHHCRFFFFFFESPFNCCIHLPLCRLHTRSKPRALVDSNVAGIQENSSCVFLIRKWTSIANYNSYSPNNPFSVWFLFFFASELH